MKQFALSLALLSAVSIISAAKLELELTHNGKTITEVLDLDVAKELVHQSEDFSVKLNVTQREDETLLVNAEVSTPNQDGAQEVIATAQALVIQGEEASVTLGSGEGDELTLIARSIK